MFATTEYVNQSRFAEVQRQLAVALAEAEELRRQLQQLQADREIVGEELLSEAENRQFCDEYNAYVTRVNARLSTPWLKHYLRDFDVTYRVRIKGRIKDLNAAYEEIYSCLQGVTVDSDVGDITDVDVQS